MLREYVRGAMHQAHYETLEDDGSFYGEISGFEASADELAEVEIVMDGEALHWERLDADLLVPELVSGVFGSRRWMREIARELGRRGGRVRSEAKAAAARRNGRKGGRPRKTRRA
ncbi:MAG: hypothetical protein HY701_07720 [Gemmatimonadetes bacterium]|nr:hypothetical protein [Gemmatimonadota bacterium]